MDPLSLTLVVVSLTTATKDLVKLGQKMHESFAKVNRDIHPASSISSWNTPNADDITQVSINLRSAQRVAEDIKEMVEESVSSVKTTRTR